MTLDPVPLKILVVSTDTTLLHDLSWVLAAVGYSVQTTKDHQQDALWRRYGDADFIVFDGRSVSGPYEPAVAYETENPVYWILLYDPQATNDFSAWYAAGGHDAMRVPVSRGELLARVRAGARYLEFERRLHKQSSGCLVPCMNSKQGFLHKLSRLASTSTSNSLRHTLLITAIDWYDGIRQRGGQGISRRLVHAAARAIKRIAGENAVTAYLGDGCFATLQLGQTPALARTAAEHLAKEFGSRESQRDTSLRPTLTTAVVAWRIGDTPDQLLELGLETLEIARHSGGDCVLEQSDFAKEIAAWRNEVTTGNPFANVVAQDIMEPFPALLECDGNQTALVDALRRSGSPVCPYVDLTGRLVGVASASNHSDRSVLHEPTTYAALPISQPLTIDHMATFAEIYEVFSTQGGSTLVVVAAGQPLGYLTFSGFVSLIEPIHSTTFALDGEVAGGTQDLMIAMTGGDPEIA